MNKSIASPFQYHSSLVYEDTCHKLCADALLSSAQTVHPVLIQKSQDINPILIIDRQINNHLFVVVITIFWLILGQPSSNGHRTHYIMFYDQRGQLSTREWRSLHTAYKMWLEELMRGLGPFEGLSLGWWSIVALAVPALIAVILSYCFVPQLNWKPWLPSYE